MDPECGDMGSSPSPGGMMEDSPRVVTYERRLELQKMAAKIAADLVTTTTRRERCILRSMVEDLLGRE